MCDVFRENGLGGVVADTAGAAQKDHGGRDAFSEDHGVVAGTARYAMRQTARRTHGGFDLGNKKRIHSDRVLLEKRGRTEREVATSSDFLGTGGESVERVGPDRIGFVADIEQEAGFARNDIGGSRATLDEAHRSNQAASASGLVFHYDHPFGCARECISSGVHGSGASMIGDAAEVKDK